MPPPIEPSEDESSGGESIPFSKTKDAAPVGAESDEEEDEDEEGEDVYVVEKILGHEFAKDGSLYLQVKWKGYENEEDQTMEPEDNLDGAQDAVDEYFSTIGGRPQPPEKPSRKRKSTADTTSTPQSSKKARKSEGAANGTSEGEGAPSWVPKSKKWDDQIDLVETITRDPASGTLYAFLHWKNGKKAKVSVQQCYERCPTKMLQFYENHLVFKDD